MRDTYEVENVNKTIKLRPKTRWAYITATPHSIDKVQSALRH
jgi:hypothetical protein